MRQMKKLLAALLASALLLTGCTGGTSPEGSSTASGEESSTVSQAPLTDEDILAEAEPYLEDTVWQDPSAYASMDEFLSSNLGLDSTQVAAVTIYMGAPNQNTSFFLMLTPTEEADPEVIREKLENKAEGMVTTAEMGYTQGYAGYKIIENLPGHAGRRHGFPGAGTASGGAGGLRKLAPCPVLTRPDARGTDPAVCAPGIFLCRGFDRPGYIAYTG